ncbi:MAG: Zn-binding domain-containing protein, partial [Gemmatimonadota bacterium]
VSTWQRAGRVGRNGRESLVLLIASRDALDQFYMKHPARFFEGHIEDAVADPSNHPIHKAHLACAAPELPLTAWEPQYDMPGWRPAVDELTREGELLQSADGDAWFASRKQPHRHLSMCSIGESWTICRSGPEGGAVIGTVSGGQLYTECYEGAVYLHRGRQYLIGGRDPVKRHIAAEEVDAPYYTRPKSDKETEVIEEVRARPMHGYMARLGRLLVSSQVTAYERVRVGDQAILGREPLDSPVQQFETVGFWLEMDAPFKKELKRLGFHHMGSIHAVEHAMKALFPLLALSKGTDLGGICYPLHPRLRRSAVFVYDQYPGGIGLAEKGFEMLDKLLELALQQVAACPCENGCPACIHSPSCGNGNNPLDKAGAVHLLELLTGQRQLAPESMEVSELEAEPPVFADWESEQQAAAPGPEPGEPHVVVFDLETQKSAAEVGGWDKAHLMRLSCGVVWDSRQQAFCTYHEQQVEELLAHLRRADLVVGFNVIGFDYSVLRGYTPFDFRQLNTLDILREIRERLHYRVSLDALARATLGSPKSADGLQALQWWKEGRLDLIDEYCRQDVALTRDLYRHVLERGYLVFDRRGEGPARVPLQWDLEALCRPASRT